MVNSLSLDIFGVQQKISVENVHYRFYNELGVMNYSSNSNSDIIPDNTNCKPGAKMNIIVHGWNENCNEKWVVQLVKNLNNPAINPDGGCTCCVDYSYYSIVLSATFANKLELFAIQKILLEQIKIICFSFGVVISVKAACMVGPNRIGSIDAIDAATPLAQPLGQKRYPTDFKQCAQHVQGIHCSSDLGTSVHDNCHENWVMGNCGIFQASAAIPTLSHLQCPIIYVYGMTNKFKSVKQPITGPCILENSDRLNTTAYDVQYMGFKMPPDYGFNTFFADTFICPPYNDLKITNCVSSIAPFA